MKEFEFLVSGRIIVAAHCREDAAEAVKDVLSDVLTHYDSVCID